MSPLEELDYVLENTLHNRDYSDIKDFFFKEDVLPKDEHYLKLILNKLNKDGYIDFTQGEPTTKTFVTNREAGHFMNIRRNFNGNLFLTAGGYVAENDRKNQLAISHDQYDDRMETYSKTLASWTRWLTIGTFAVALGAIALVVWEIVAYFLEHKKQP